MPFLNDVEIKKFNNVFANHEKIASEICKKVLKYIQWLNQILIDIKRAGCIIFEKKIAILPCWNQNNWIRMRWKWKTFWHC